MALGLRVYMNIGLNVARLSGVRRGRTGQSQIANRGRKAWMCYDVEAASKNKLKSLLQSARANLTALQRFQVLPEDDRKTIHSRRHP
jgi:hypothetical protein